MINIKPRNQEKKETTIAMFEIKKMRQAGVDILKQVKSECFNAVSSFAVRMEERYGHEIYCVETFIDTSRGKVLIKEINQESLNLSLKNRAFIVLRFVMYFRQGLCSHKSVSDCKSTLLYWFGEECMPKKTRLVRARERLFGIAV